MKIEALVSLALILIALPAFATADSIGIGIAPAEKTVLCEGECQAYYSVSTTKASNVSISIEPNYDWISYPKTLSPSNEAYLILTIRPKEAKSYSITINAQTMTAGGMIAVKSSVNAKLFLKANSAYTGQATQTSQNNLLNNDNTLSNSTQANSTQANTSNNPQKNNTIEENNIIEENKATDSPTGMMLRIESFNPIPLMAFLGISAIAGTWFLRFRNGKKKDFKKAYITCLILFAMLMLPSFANAADTPINLTLAPPTAPPTPLDPFIDLSVLVSGIGALLFLARILLLL